MENVINITSGQEDVDIAPSAAEPPPMCADYTKPDKQEAIAGFTTRFKASN